MRSAIGTQLDAFPCWMIARSLETLSLRMAAANRNGQIVAEFLKTHPAVARVYYLGFLPEGSPERKVYERSATRRARRSPSTSTAARPRRFAFSTP